MSYIGQIPLPQATEERIERTATAGQTSFTGLTYVNGFISVYLNGVKLDNADFTATDGTTVTLATGAAAGDTVSFVSTTQTSALVALPLKDSSGAAILSESGSTVTLANVDTATIGSNALVVNSSGNVGIGTSSPSQKLSVAGNAMLQANQGFLYLSDVGTGNSGIYVRGTGTSNEFRSHSTGTFTWEVIGSQKMIINANGTIGAPSGTNIYNGSDERIKKNIVQLSDCLQKILSMRGVSFNWIDGYFDEEFDKPLYGFIAQEAEIVDPNLVDKFSEDPIVINDVVIENVLRVNEKFIIPMLVESIKEQQTIIESQQSQIDALTARIEALETT